MNYLIRGFLAALMLVAPCWAAADAGGCYVNRTYSNYPVVVEKKVIVEKDVLVATFVPLVVTVPTYSATYVNGYAQQAIVPPAQAVAQGYPQQPQGQSLDVQAFQQLLTRINERLTTIETSLQGGTSTTAQGAAQANDYVKVFAAKCADCHGSTPRDNKLSLFTPDKQLVKLTDGQVGKIQNRVFRSKEDKKVMPPSGHPGLTDQEVGLLGAWAEAMLSGGNASTSGAGAPAQMSVPQMK